LQQFILMVEGPGFEELDEIELPRLPQEGDPIETKLGTCFVVRTESASNGGNYDGRIVCRLP
jgi:hypothetical protein